ncbi:TerB family tellurite resistance protein [Myxococcus sp. CA051A]|uniref:TerB family tellurite resistance protein n=1 Tax=Myxococcus llanfairpwllgwyngyllgogerychwyrndrobwllllantysiliogogogochensis TaxID=2590453 RepID=A0A540WIZ6_9BACT|nr:MULTISPECIES: TerB family tellurite resistance protein [Myxococcus]NTX08162.1 TerB family tellurite resistance protein [Myxococcus sp. CA040A]NTX13556.1 TerB family tellurite resistance protein [Myxococcus sp. CA056]NTX38852.1 TerB family tellurite resistance protein [Myxococcus sp. CA033]NTX55819.1 TerB family tellurite resistance protein [Myxococcus sp. CA039A]NTX67420.1 TerB family tellurite resistance protein [Myxococcus sp. CA051A]
MSTPSSPDSRFQIEVLKLLLQVASGDEGVSRQEIDHIMDTARGMSVPLPELAELAKCLQNGIPLPAPNLGVLRSNPQAVVEATHALISSDGHIHPSEIEMLRQIREMLGVAG